MNDEIDLTEKKYFKDKYTDPLSVKRNLPRLPWEVTENEFANLLKNKRNYNYNPYDSLYSYNSISSTSFNNYINTSFIEYNDNLNEWIIVNKNGSHKYLDVFNKYKNFPIGRVSDIRLYNRFKKDREVDDISITLKRKNNILKELEEDYEYNSNIHCCKCNRLFTVSEILFNNLKKNEYHNSHMCSECYIKYKRDKFNLNHENIWVDLAKSYHKKCDDHTNFLRNEKLIGSLYNLSVPCLSSNIKPIKHHKTKINEMHEYFHYYEETPLNFVIRKPDGKINRSKCVSYKNRGELEWRESEWQPKGRVSQSYDRMFEDIDWQNMLKYRLGEIDSIVDPNKPDKFDEELIEISYIEPVDTTRDLFTFETTINNNFQIVLRHEDENRWTFTWH